MAAHPVNIKTLYHGTKGEHAASILATGLRPSASGRLGAGIYFTFDKDVAIAIAKHRGLQFVVTCEVDIGNSYDFDQGGSATWAVEGFDSARSKHPRWCGVGPFIEVCVSDPKRVKRMHVEGYIPNPPSVRFVFFCRSALCSYRLGYITNKRCSFTRGISSIRKWISCCHASRWEFRSIS